MIANEIYPKYALVEARRHIYTERNRIKSAQGGVENHNIVINKRSASSQIQPLRWVEGRGAGELRSYSGWETLSVWFIPGQTARGFPVKLSHRSISKARLWPFRETARGVCQSTAWVTWISAPPLPSCSRWGQWRVAGAEPSGTAVSTPTCARIKRLSLQRRLSSEC